MRNRNRVLLLASSIMATASFLRAQCATPPLGGGMLGPNPAKGDAPAFFDSDGSGGPSPCDETILPTYDSLSDAITIPNPYQDCDGSGALHNQFFLLRDKGGTPTEIHRDRGDQTEVLTPTNFFAPFEPTSGHLDIFKNGSLIKSGDGHLVPAGGFFGGVSGGQTLGGNVSAAMSFIYGGQAPDGGPAYISLPWSQLAALGLLNHIDGNCPAGDPPPIFVPLSNGKIVLDLDGDGAPDPPFFNSPPLTRQAAIGEGIPAVSRGTMALLACALVGAALFQLRRGGLGF